jgi:hypothetical protein
MRCVFVCAFLQFGTLIGIPMRPKEIQELLQMMNAPKIASVLPSDEQSGDGPPDPPPV